MEPRLTQPRGCAHTLWLANVWKKRAYEARMDYYRWRESRFVLHDFAAGGGNHGWLKAVKEVQKVFPGTESWLLSCSWAEGRHGRWMRHGGGGYYPGFENEYVVGGWMQFKWPTFKGMYRHAIDHAADRGFKIPANLRDSGDVRAWLSPLAQAMAAGWARYTGNDDSHWSASWGNGC